MTRPGTRIRSIMARIFDPSTMTRLIDPAIADLQHEHDEAVRRGLGFRGRWIRTAGYIGVWKVIAASATIAVTHAISEWARADDRAVGRTISYSVAAIAVVVAVFVAIPFSRLSQRVPTDTSMWIVVFLVPQALVVAIPLGLLFGVLSGLRGRVATRRVRRSITAFAIMCSISAFVLVGWTMPAANQAFRQMISGHRLAPGLNELTLDQLVRRPARTEWLVSVPAGRLSFEFHFRLALALASLVLGLFAVAVTSAWRGAYHVRSIVILGSLVSFVYYALLFWSRQVGYPANEPPAVAVAWTPNLVFLTTTLLVFRGMSAAETHHSPP
jgi:lipopolysaccharide export LptBFGC system permease protein LptF